MCLILYCAFSLNSATQQRVQISSSYHKHNRNSQNTARPIRLEEIVPTVSAFTPTPISASSPNESSATLDSTVIENTQPPSQSQSTNVITNHGIRIAEKRTYLCLSGFHHTSTTQQVSSFVSRVLGLSEGDVICRSLKSGRRTYTDFHHISFRIGLRSTHIADALQQDKWPAGISCKLFNSKN